MRNNSVLFWCSFVIAGLAYSGGVKAGEDSKKSSSILAEISMPGKPQEMSFEILMEGKSLGYSHSKLTPSSEEKICEYQVAMVTVLPNGARIEGDIRANLKGAFEPTDVEMKRTMVGPDGKKQEVVESAEVKAAEIVVGRRVGSSPVDEKRVPRPASPFVFGMEHVLAAVNLDKNSTFDVPELDPQRGEVVVQQFKNEKQSGGDRTLSSQPLGGTVGYVFGVDSKGAISSWSEGGAGIVMKRCSAERLEELRKQFAPK